MSDLERQISRAAELDGRLRCFALTTPEAARKAAWRVQKEGVAGPLAGRTLAIKDLFDQKGLPTGGGCRTPVVEEARTDAGAVARLLAAGMLPVGKAAMVELAFGTWGINRAAGTPVNPWDPEVPRVPGGSSSGSAVAVAAGLADMALGSDTGGSIRIPCALNGLTGVKPTVGRVTRSGALPLSTTLDTVGPMCRTIAEAVRMLAVLAGPDQGDPASLDRPAFDAGEALDPRVKGRSIGVLGDRDLGVVSDAVGGAYQESLEVLDRAGARLVTVRPAVAFDACVEPTGRLIAHEAWRHWSGRVDRRGGEMDPGVLGRLQTGAAVTEGEHARLLAARAADQGRFHAWLQDVDALLTPTVPIVAPPIDEADEGRLPFSHYTRAANWLDLPAVAVPNGADGKGLPTSLQVLALPWREAAALSVAGAFQAATRWHERRPPIG